MAQRLPNPRRAKIHRSYTVEEVAQLYGVHRNTVRQWIKQGLPVCDDRRPVLVQGGELAVFLTRKRASNKHPCKAGEIYCVRCRAPQSPALGMADYEPLTSHHRQSHWPMSDVRWDDVPPRQPRPARCRRGKPGGPSHARTRNAYDESNDPSVNSDFKTGA